MKMIRVIALLAVMGAGLLTAASAHAAEKRPVDWVDPLIGTEGSRWFFFSSACRPFGMVNLSPDTGVGGAWGSGYLYGHEFIHGMSHVHAWQLSGVPVMPTVGEFKGHKGSEKYGSRFSHERETVRPGHHSVFLEDYKIRAELTSTDRVGFHRYTFPEAKDAYLVFNLGARLGPSGMDNAMARKVSDTEIEGSVVNSPTRRRPKPTPVFFVARLDKPFQEFGGWKGLKVEEDIDRIEGKNSGAYLRFSTNEQETVLLKVAISYCSIEQARLNLESELGHWDFDRVTAESEEVWNKWLSRIKVEGGTPRQMTKFYTDLWHALQGRRKTSDVNGKYADMTGEEMVVRQIPLDGNGRPLYNHYNSDAFWGAQWSISLLWSLAYPDVMSEFVNSLIDMYENGGLIPRGPSGGNYTFVMTSATSTPFIAAAYQKGIRDFDVETAYEGMKKNHLPGGLMSKAGYEHGSNRGGGIEYYMERGYVPVGIMANAFHVAGAGQTLEYAYQDWCLAQTAKELGRQDDYRRFTDRSMNYKNLYDENTGYMRPRTLLGTWMWPFSPRWRYGWVESNAIQSTWFVPHDVAGLIELMGGQEKFNKRLVELFEEGREYDFAASHNDYSTGLNFGNQPAMQVAHLFNYSGAPWLSQKWVRQVHKQTFSGTAPGSGYPDDEDQGIIGSLSALMAIGLFDVQGGCNDRPNWQITTPLFDKITITLHPEYYDGEKFVIETFNNKPDNIYIRSAELDGRDLNKAWFYHDELVKGGKLELELGPEPDRQWWTGPPPPSR
jgi:predicted alpha-1,2-mannosidase